MKTKLILLLTLTIVLSACKKVKEPLPNEPNYMPLEVGKYITYEYKVIKHDALQETSDTSVSWLRETQESTLLDAAGKLNHKVLIEQSIDSGETWQYVKDVLLYVDEENAFRIEDNMRISKISFPLRERKFWDANIQNSKEYQRARMYDIANEKQLNSFSFSNTLSVDLGEDIDPFFQTKEEELYAEGVGLIYRAVKDLETQPTKYINGIEIYKTIYATNWPIR